jgi:hypothetical protein
VPGHHVERSRDARAGVGAHSVGRVPQEGRIEKSLVDLGRDEVEPFLQGVAKRILRRRCELGLGLQVGDSLEDGSAFGQSRPVLEPQDRDLALRRDGEEIGILVKDSLRLEIDATVARLDAGLEERDAARERARERGEVQFEHGEGPPLVRRTDAVRLERAI